MEVGVRLKVLGLEVVSPQHPQVVLDHLGALFFDHHGSDLEVGVVGGGVLLLARFDRLRFDLRLGWVVHAAGEVAVRGGDLWRTDGIHE